MSLPRAVIVKRPSEYEELLATHGTFGQAAFFLRTRNRSIDEVQRQHQLLETALSMVLSGIPRSWRRAVVQRAELDRFLFEPEDLVIAVGQDGLVANVARFLSGQKVLGVNPNPGRNDGILVRHSSAQALKMLPTAQGMRCQKRTMIQATLDDGQKILALNEIFFGHSSHQSARYKIQAKNMLETHSSSGVIVSSGTGATGWGRSIHLCHHSSLTLPTPEEQAAIFFVREAFPSRATQTTLTEGRLEANEKLLLTCELGDGGVLFGDGIEVDRLELKWGQQVSLGIADQTLNLL
jgi:NAD kinase